MLRIKVTEEYKVYTEDEAKTEIETLRQSQTSGGYKLSAAGYTYKCKKAKGEIVDECYIVKAVKVFQEVWD